MIILPTSNQSFYIIPRSYEADSMTLTNELTNEIDTYSITPSTSDHYMVITEELTPTENHFYILKVYDGTDIIYRDRVFCTDQDTETFSVNDNVYTEHTSNNDFIIIS